MKKFAYSLALFCLLIFVSFFIIHQHDSIDTDTFRCSALFEQESFVKNDINHHEYPLKTNIYIALFLKDKESGFFSISGTVEDNKKVYTLSRRSTFTIAPNTLQGMKMVTVTNEIVAPIDDTPQEFWRNHISPGKPGTVFYIDTLKINNNTVMFKSPLFPLLVCVIQKH
ncbi:hypothetical protein ACQKDS_02415 [Serratia sp. NPDC078593]|uniref:hypothetical protein n=1 Tax=unclassified Serratia (in: enterobacteria) TaxID=2647522 RepID=UPI0037D827D1